MKLIKNFFLGLTVTVASLPMGLTSQASAADTDVLPTSTDDISYYRAAGRWVVFKNATRESCFVTKQDDNTAIQMGLTKGNKLGYLGAFLKDGNIRGGSQGVAFSVNGRPYTGNARVFTRELSSGFMGAYVLVNNPNFVEDIMVSREMVTFLHDPYRLNMNIAGAGNAIYEARECMKEF